VQGAIDRLWKNYLHIYAANADEVTESEFVFKICPALGNLPVTEALPQPWRTIAQFIQKNYPHGLKIKAEGDKEHENH